jgi:hypothetical protein
MRTLASSISRSHSIRAPERIEYALLARGHHACGQIPKRETAGDVREVIENLVQLVSPIPEEVTTDD